MMPMHRAVAALAAGLGLVFSGTAFSATAPDPPPAEVFFKPPDIAHAALSPGGRWLAMSTHLAGARMTLAVFDLKNWGQVRLAARFSDADIHGFQWVNDERLVFEVIDLNAGSGDQPHAPGLFSVRHDGSELRNLIELRGQRVTSDRRIGRSPLSTNHRLLHVPADGSDEVIVGMYGTPGSGDLRDVSPMRLNVLNGQTRSLAGGAPPATRHWWFDATGRPRAVAAGEQGRVRLYWKASEASEWQLLADHDRFAVPFVPRFFDAAGDLFVTVAAGPGGTSELRRFDYEKRLPGAEAVARASGFDFVGSLVSESPGGKTLGVRIETDAETTVWFDPRLKALQLDIDQRLPGRVNQLSCRRCSAPDMVVLIKSWSDREPGTYWLYRADTRDLRVVGRSRSGVDPQRMARLDFQRIKARDGRDLPLWLTLPAGAEAGPRPAVVLVHGGPWVKGGRWQWQAMPQFLASRGYVVIEPEFRGSRGYGSAHLQAGVRQWGLAMQDDVADALQWAVDKGLADGQRACIAGASYGGYATLMGLVKHPQLYRCGAAWAAVTDPLLMFRWSFLTDQSDEVRAYDYPRLIGDPVTDAEQLRATSPVLQAARIKAPVLLAMGQQDRRVPIEHGTRMRDALRDAGNAPEWILYADEGHGWLTLKNKVDFAQHLEDFLARHLKRP